MLCKPLQKSPPPYVLNRITQTGGMPRRQLRRQRDWTRQRRRQRLARTTRCGDAASCRPLLRALSCIIHTIHTIRNTVPHVLHGVGVVSSQGGVLQEAARLNAEAKAAAQRAEVLLQRSAESKAAIERIGQEEVRAALFLVHLSHTGLKHHTMSCQCQGA